MNRYLILLLIAAASVITSCQQEEVTGDGQHGYLSIGLSEDLGDKVHLKSGEESGDQITDESAEEDVEERIYRLVVTDSKGNVDFEVDDYTQVTDPIALLMDKYTVAASNGEPQTGFNLPYWYGSNEVRIYAERNASVDITCRMKKVIFSVTFPEDEEFKSKFPSYELEVTNGTDVLTFSSAPKTGEGTFSDIAYFVVTPEHKLTYTLKMKNSQNSFYYTTREINNVAEAEHYHFNFSLGEREDIEGALVVSVLLNGEYSEANSHEVLLNFDKFDMPSYSHNREFEPDAEEDIIYPLGNNITKRFTFSAPRKMKSLVISHLDANLLSEGLPQVLEFVNMTDSDKAIAAELGIEYSTVTDQSVEAYIDVTEFVRQLPISPDGQPYCMSVTVIDTHNRYARCDFEFAIVSDIQAETVSAFRWSSFAILKGRFFSRVAPDGVSFQYKKVSDTEWIEVDAPMDVDLSTLTYSYRLKGLDKNTDYVFRATSTKDKADGKTATEVTFKTYANEGTVYNLSFDDWVKVGKAWYATSNSDDVNTGLVWDSANEGTADILGQSLVPTTPEETIKISGKAVRMESGELLGNFAAGNIYTGDFGSATISPVGAKLKWGTPFNSRPLALKGWYRYEPVPINRTSDAYSYLSGQDDFCQIQIFLTTWKEQFEISTGDNRFVDTSTKNKDIIAHGQIVSQDNTTDNPGASEHNGYVPFIIPLQYRNLNEPTYIVISGAASRYGDYFTGGLGSTLYLDELELVYDPDLLTDEELELVLGGVK